VKAPQTIPPAQTWRIWAGLQCAPMTDGRGELLGRCWVADKEAVRNVCGVRTAMLQGQSWAPNLSNGLTVNMGTTLMLPNSIGHGPKSGKVHRPPMAPGWGGGPVVVRGRESRPHGEGVQRVRGTQATCEGRR
jgi:hypothetical protein